MPRSTPPQSSPPDSVLTLPTLAQDALTAAHGIIVDHCWAAYPKEAVGLIWDDGQVVGLDGKSRSNSFYVAPRMLKSTLATRPRRSAIAVYHSHPSGTPNPSSTDMACMKDWAEAGVDILWTIVALGAFDNYPSTSTAVTYTYHPDSHSVTPYHRLSS